jgi:soluble lytic murein transglycosylase-like protein
MERSSARMAAALVLALFVPSTLLAMSSMSSTENLEAMTSTTPAATTLAPPPPPPSSSSTTTTSTTSTTTTTLPEPIAGRCTQWEPLLEAHAERTGWDVERMSRIAYRESRCIADIRSKTSDTGVLQVNDINHRYLSEALGFEVTVESLKIPEINIAAAAALCEYWTLRRSGCYQPWVATDRG